MEETDFMWVLGDGKVLIQIRMLRTRRVGATAARGSEMRGPLQSIPLYSLTDGAGEQSGRWGLAGTGPWDVGLQCGVC